MDKDEIATLLYKTKEILDRLSYACKYDSDFPEQSDGAEIQEAKANILLLETLFTAMVKSGNL